MMGTVWTTSAFATSSNLSSSWVGRRDTGNLVFLDPLFWRSSMYLNVCVSFYFLSIARNRAGRVGGGFWLIAPFCFIFISPRLVCVSECTMTVLCVDVVV